MTADALPLDEARLAALPEPPLLPGLPLLGNALDLLRDLAGTFAHGYARLGPAFRVRAPGYELTVLAGREANQFFSRHGEAVLSSRRAYHRILREVGDYYLQGMDGPAHDHLRRRLQPGFSREAICTYIPIIAQAIHQSARAWTDGQRLNVRDCGMRLAADALTLALTNTSIEPVFAEVRRYGETLIGAGVAVWPPVLLRWPAYRMARARVEQFLDSLLARHQAQPPGDARPADLVDLVLGLRDSQGQPLGLAEQRACLQVAPVNSLMYVGRALGFLLYDLLKHPEAAARVQQEIDEVFAHGLPDPALLRQLPALRGAVLESLRLHPSAFLLPRVATRTFEFSGYRIPAGRSVLMGTTLGHFDPALFPNPHTFDLDRYAEPRSEHRQPGAYAPFGVGGHTCLSLGMVESVLMIAAGTLLRTVRLQLDPPGYRLKTVVNPVPGPEAGFRLRVLGQRQLSLPTHIVRPGALAADRLAEVLPSLSPAQLARLSARLKPRLYVAGTVIVREGEPADFFYILIRGEAAVLKRTAAGAAKEVARLEAGTYFGEIGLVHGVPRTATVQAVTPVQVLALDRETFLAMVVEADLTSAEIARLMRQRFVSANLAAALPSLTADDVRGLAAGVELVRYPPSSVILRQGDPPEKFYIIARGRVEVVNHHPSGREIVLAERGPGEYFGEAGLLQGRPRTATVRVGPEGEVEVLELGRESFQQLLAGSAPTAEAITHQMVVRLIDTLAAEEAAETSGITETKKAAD